MFFKNIQIYKFNGEFNFNAEHLNNELANAKFYPCSSIMQYSMGWVSPITGSSDDSLVHAANGFILLALKVEEKIIPAVAVRDQLNKKVKEIESNQMSRITRKEKLGLKDDIIASMTPRAFTKSHVVTAYIDPRKELLIINTPTKNKAEIFVSFLRKTLGSLPISIPNTGNIATIMTNWVKLNAAPQGFRIENNCLLTGTLEASRKIKCDNNETLSDNVKNFIKDGMQVSRLKLNFNGLLTFNLKDDFSMVSLKFSDLAKDKVSNRDITTEAEHIDASFFIMTETLSEFIAKLFEIFVKQGSK